jgi:hypothetical protein
MKIRFRNNAGRKNAKANNEITTKGTWTQWHPHEKVGWKCDTERTQHDPWRRRRSRGGGGEEEEEEVVVVVEEDEMDE